MKNRKGVIKIAKHFFDNIDQYQKEMQLLFCNFIPAYIEHTGFTEIVYSGYSSHFDEINEAEPIPVYEAIFTGTIVNDQSQVEVSFRRV